MKSKKSIRRDGEETRRAILAAAAEEFIEKGFHGARMEHIATRAGVNKALVYRYYGDRDNLVREVLKVEIAQRESILERVPDTLGDALAFWYRETVRSGGNLIKLLQREALDTDHAVVHRRRRREYYAAQMEILRTWQQEGRVNADFDVPYLFLALLALIAFPIGFPQLTQLVTGRKPHSRGFVDSWTTLLTKLARCIDDGNVESSGAGNP